MMKVYFDNAATTPMAPEVLEAMLPYMQDHFGNPSAIHAYGRKTRAAVEQARRQVAALLNCAPGEIIFTSGGTEADNMVLGGAVRDLGVQHIITSPIEHHAVESTAEQLGKENGVTVHWVQLEADGKPDRTHLEELLKATKGQGVLVSLMHANNEIGTRIDLQAIGSLCRTYGALFHSDTVQTMGHYHFDLEKLPVDFITCAAPFAPTIGKVTSAILLRHRILRLLTIARCSGYTSLVLGAWGCGAFGNDPHRTAEDFRSAIEKDFAGHFSTIVFAITDWSPERRFLAPFRAVFT